MFPLAKEREQTVCTNCAVQWGQRCVVVRKGGGDEDANQPASFAAVAVAAAAGNGELLLSSATCIATMSTGRNHADGEVGRTEEFDFNNDMDKRSRTKENSNNNTTCQTW